MCWVMQPTSKPRIASRGSASRAAAIGHRGCIGTPTPPAIRAASASSAATSAAAAVRGCSRRPPLRASPRGRRGRRGAARTPRGRRPRWRAAPTPCGRARRASMSTWMYVASGPARAGRQLVSISSSGIRGRGQRRPRRADASTGGCGARRARPPTAGGRRGSSRGRQGSSAPGGEALGQDPRGSASAGGRRAAARHDDRPPALGERLGGRRDGARVARRARRGPTGRYGARHLGVEQVAGEVEAPARAAAARIAKAWPAVGDSGASTRTDHLVTGAKIRSVGDLLRGAAVRVDGGPGRRARRSAGSRRTPRRFR